MNKICFLAQFPPPIHGLSKAVDTLYNSSLKDKYSFTAINITSNKQLLSSICKILMVKTDVFYFTISQTKMGNWRDLLFFKLIQSRKKKCIVHLHGGYYRQLIEKDCETLQKRLNYNAMKHVSAVIVLGNSLKTIFEGMLPSNKIYIVPNCFDKQYGADSIIGKKNNLLAGAKLHVMYLSNFIATKGYREVLQLALLAKQNKDDIHFDFAGKFFDMTEEDYFMSFIKDNELDTYVTYHGIVSGEEKQKLLESCHVFALLTRYPNEGQPISILEAMGNGMAIVTTNHAGIPDIATSRNGFVCDKSDIDINVIYQELQNWNKDRTTLVDICDLNYEVAQKTYTEEQYLNNMDKVFEGVCNE